MSHDQEIAPRLEISNSGVSLKYIKQMIKPSYNKSNFS